MNTLDDPFIDENGDTIVIVRDCDGNIIGRNILSNRNHEPDA